MSISPFMLRAWTSSIQIHFIYIRNFRLHLYRVLACVLRFAYRNHQSSALGWFLLEQWCKGCGFESLLVRSLDRESSVPQIELALPLGRSPRAALSIGIRFDRVSREVYRCFPLFRLVLFQYLNSTKKALKNLFSLSHNLIVPLQFFFQFAFLNFSPLSVIVFAVSRSINSSLSELLILVFHHNSLVLVLCNEEFFFKKRR